MMNWWHHYEIAALLNWAACSVIGLLCIDQLNGCRCRENLVDRARYALLLTGAMASGLQPVLWGEWPSWSDAFMSFAVCLWLGLSSRRVHTPDYDGPQRRLEDA